MGYRSFNYVFNNGYESSKLVDVVYYILLVSVISKSAQLLKNGWLYEAMEGPTTASTLIHAATLVTAGIYLLSKVSGSATNSS